MKVLFSETRPAFALSHLLLTLNISLNGLFCLFLPLPLGCADPDPVVDALVGAGALHSLVCRTDEVLPDPEGLAEFILSHSLTQLLQDKVLVRLAAPFARLLNEQAL